MMRAVFLENGKYTLRNTAIPSIKPDEVLVKVAFAGVNRVDLFQLQAKYPLPENGIPGLEVSGEVIAIGNKVQHIKIGTQIASLLEEGGFAEYVAVPASLILEVPPNFSLEAAACLPEACFTSWISLVWQAKLQRDESVLIHGGAGGVGHIAIQIAKYLGAKVFTTAGTEEKCQLCYDLGAEVAINYHAKDFAKTIAGVDVILDMVGGEYLDKNLSILRKNGRLCIIAFLKGAKIQANFAPVLLNHLSIFGSTLRSRPLVEKAQIAEEIRQHLWAGVEQKRINPRIDSIFSLENAEKALKRMEEGLNIGKIVIKL